MKCKPSRSEMRVFGRVYSEEDIYIKIRVELVSTQACGDSFIFVMSFHYAEWEFKECDFPYKKDRGAENANIKKRKKAMPHLYGGT